jgi:hypothetical protein
MELFALLFVIAISLLMVSRVPTWSGKKFGSRVPRDYVLPVFVVVVLMVALLISFPWEVLAVGSLLYLAAIPFAFAHYKRLDLGAHPRRPRIGRLPADIEHIRARLHQPHSMLDRRPRLHIPIRKRIRRDIHHAHDQRPAPHEHSLANDDRSNHVRGLPAGPVVRTRGPKRQSAATKPEGTAAAAPARAEVKRARVRGRP